MAMDFEKLLELALGKPNSAEGQAAWKLLKQANAGSIDLTAGQYAMKGGIAPEVLGAPYTPNFTMQGGNLPVPYGAQVPANLGTGFTMEGGGGGVGGASAARASNTARPIAGMLEAPVAGTPGGTVPPVAAAKSGVSKLAGIAGKAGKFAGKVAPWLMLGSVANEGVSENERGNVSGEGYLQNLKEMVLEGKDNPDAPNILNYISRVGNTPLREGTNLAKSAWEGGKDLYNWATTPKGEWEKEKTVEVGKKEAQPTMLDAWADAVLEKVDLNLQTTLPVGTVETDLEVPEMGIPASVDTTEVREWMAKAAPQGMTEEQVARLERASLLEGLAQGMANIGPNERIGDMLLSLGSGALAGKAKGEKAKIELEIRDAAAKQQFAQLMAGNTLKLEELDVSQRNAVMDVGYRNAISRMKMAMDEAEKKKPKFLGMQGGVAVYETTEGDQRVLKGFDVGTLARQRQVKAGALEKTGDFNLADAAAGISAPTQDPMGYYTMIAGQLVNQGLAPNVLGEEAYSALNEQVIGEVGQSPGSETQKGESYKNVLAGNIAGAMMNNPEYLVRAAQYSPYAALLLARMRKKNGKLAGTAE